MSSHFIPLLLLTICTACASFKPVSRSALSAKDLPGVWISDPATMKINCNGTYSLQNPGYGGGHILEHTASDQGSFISKIGDDFFTLDPFARKFSVKQWPTSTGNGGTIAVIDDQTWTRENSLNCEN